MEIFNLVRGHFALLIDYPLETLAEHKPFTITKVHQQEGDWQISIKLSSGNITGVYISDILRVYTEVVSINKPIALKRINEIVQKFCVNKASASYIAPMLGTFGDIIINMTGDITIEYVTFREKLSKTI